MRKIIMLIAAVVGLCFVIDLVRNAGGVLLEKDVAKTDTAAIAPRTRAPIPQPVASQPVQPTDENGMSDEAIRQMAMSAAKEAKAVTLTQLTSGLRAEAAGIRVDMPGTLVSNTAVRDRRLVVTESKTGTTYGFFVTFGDNWGESPLSSLGYQFIENVNNTFQDRGWNSPPVPSGRKLGQGTPMSGLLWEISGEKVDGILWIGRSQNGRYVGVYVLGLSGNAASKLDAKEVGRYFSSLHDVE